MTDTPSTLNNAVTMRHPDDIRRAREPVQELDVRIAKASKVMGIAAKDLLLHLQAIGIDYSEDGLALLESDAAQEGDARAVMVEGQYATTDPKGRPPAAKLVPFKAGWAILKGRGQTKDAAPTNGIDKLVDSLRPIAQYSDDELIAKYGPDSGDDLLDELRRRSHDRPFVVFNGDDAVEVETTLSLLRVARRGITPRTFPLKGGALARVYPVGMFPMLWLEECPIHGNSILADGYCDECGASWKGTPMATRVALRIGINEGLIQPGALNTLAAASACNFEALMESYAKLPRVALRYKELADEQKLPVLRRRFSGGNGASSDPFYVRK